MGGFNHQKLRKFINEMELSKYNHKLAIYTKIFGFGVFVITLLVMLLNTFALLYNIH